jgi:hypothetical protein
MTIIGVVVFGILLAICVLHALWAVGSHFPAPDEAALARMVTGFPGSDRMPPRAASFGVALATLAAGLFGLALAGIQPFPLPFWLGLLGGIALSVVFLGRGFITYTRGWRKLTPEQPFAKLDRQLYGPLCLLLGTGFALLTKGYAS